MPHIKGAIEYLLSYRRNVGGLVDNWHLDHPIGVSEKRK